MFVGKFRSSLRYWFVAPSMLSWLATASCERITPAESKVIGTWEFTGLDATVRLVFRRDHTVVSLSSQADGSKGKWAPAAWGTWRLEANEIVTDEEVFPIAGYLPKHRQVARVPIRAFEEDRLMRADGRSDFYRVHSNAYSLLVPFFYLIASIIGFLGSIYGIRHYSLRRVFAWLGLGAAFAIVWSFLTLVAELAERGAVIISPASLDWWKFPTEILRIAFIVIFAIGFVNLAYRLRVSAPTQDRI